MAGKLLLYSLPSSKESFHQEKVVSLLCKELGFHTRQLHVSDSNLTVGKLIGIPSQKTPDSPLRAPKDYVLPGLLIFCQATSNDLDVFLSKWEEASLPSIDLKAAVTPYNVQWTLYQLIQELEKEHQAYAQKESR